MEEESFNSLFEYLRSQPQWRNSLISKKELKNNLIRVLMKEQSIVMKTREDIKFISENYNNEKVFIENIISSWINIAFKHRLKNTATFIYILYFYRGYIDRQKFIISSDIENYFLKGTGIPGIYFDLFDLFSNKMHSLKKVITYFTQVVKKKADFSKSPGFKRGLKIILKYKFIKNLNLLLQRQLPQQKYIAQLVHHTKQHKLLYFLIELRLNLNSQKSLTLNEKVHFQDKFRIDLDELENLYLIAKKKTLKDFLKEFLINGIDPETLSIVKEFVYIENKELPKSNTIFTKSLINNSVLFKVFELNSQICWHGLFLQKGFYDLALQTFPKTNLEKLHGGIMNCNIIVDLIELRSKKILNRNKDFFLPKFDSINIKSREECSKTFSENLQGPLVYSPMLYLLMNGGNIEPEVLKQKFLYAYENEKFNFWTFYVYLNLKIIDIFKLEFIFDYMFFKKISLYGNSLKKGQTNPFRDRKNASTLKYIDDQVRKYDMIFDNLYQFDELFCSLFQLKKSMNKTELLIFEYFLQLVPGDLANATEEEKVNHLLGKYLFDEWIAKTQDEELKKLIQDIIQVEPFTDSITSFIRDPSKSDHNYWEAIVSNTYYLKSLLKVMKDELIESTRKLNKSPKLDVKLNPNHICTLEGFNFEVGFFILLITDRLKIFNKACCEKLFENYDTILLYTDVMFKIIDKASYFCSCSFLTKKENWIKTYLMSMGIITKPSHITTFSSSLYNPLSILYMQVAYSKMTKTTKLSEILQAMKNGNPAITFVAKLQTLKKILKNDKDWAEINANFRNFIFIPKKNNILSTSLAFQINLKMDHKENIENTNLFNFELHHDELLIDKFYVLESICKFQKKPKHNFYLDLERTFYYATYYQIMLLQTKNIRKKYRLISTVEDLLEFHFGKGTSNIKFWKNVKLLNLSYYGLYKKMKIFRFRLKDVFDQNLYHLDYRKLGEETKSVLKVIYLLQTSEKNFNEISWLEALKSPKIKLKSDITSLVEFSKYLLSSTPKGSFIRSL